MTEKIEPTKMMALPTEVAIVQTRGEDLRDIAEAIRERHNPNRIHLFYSPDELLEGQARPRLIVTGNYFGYGQDAKQLVTRWRAKHPDYTKPFTIMYSGTPSPTQLVDATLIKEGTPANLVDIVVCSELPKLLENEGAGLFKQFPSLVTRSEYEQYGDRMTDFLRGRRDDPRKNA